MNRISTSEIRNPDRTVLPAEMYYSGTCGSDETNEQIATQFLAIFNSTGFSSTYCSVDDACTVQNVIVTCGPASTGRRRRSIFIVTDDWREGRVKRSGDDRYVRLIYSRQNGKKIITWKCMELKC